MNATHTEDERFLDAAIEAARSTPGAGELDTAVRRFRRALPKPKTGRTGRWLRWATVAVAAVVVASIGPLFIPGGNGNAFAAVQAWFANYRTVHMTTVTRKGEREISRMSIWSKADGATRLEVGSMVTIIDPGKHEMHTLLPDKRVMTVPLAGGRHDSNAGGDLIQQLRAFQGKAEKLDETRVIDGVKATGYRLRMDGVEAELWAATADNRPLMMDVDLQPGVVMRTRFTFNAALPPHAFSVPPDYQPVQPDED